MFVFNYPQKDNMGHMINLHKIGRAKRKLLVFVFELVCFKIFFYLEFFVLFWGLCLGWGC